MGVHRVRHLPRMDVFSATDPLVVVELVNSQCESRPQALTPVAWNDANAVFNVSLEFGEARPETVASFYLELSAAFGQQIHPEMFPLASQQPWQPSADEGSAELPDATFEEFLRQT